MIINSQLGGKKPTGTMYIISNGIYNVADKAIANVQVPTTAPDYYIEFTKDANNVLNKSSTVINLTGVEEIGANALSSIYQNMTSITALPSLSGIKKINTAGLQSCFFSCTNAQGTLDLSSLVYVGESGLRTCFYKTKVSGAINLSSLITIGGNYALYQCFAETNISSLDISNLVDDTGLSSTIAGICQNCPNLTSFNAHKFIGFNNNSGFSYGCQNCTSLTSVDFSSVVYINSYGGMNSAFQNTALSSISFDSLVVVTGGMAFNYAFSQCSNLTTAYFPSLRRAYIGNGFINCFSQCTAFSTISFPALKEIQQGCFSNTLVGCSNVTVHFPSNMQSTMSSWAEISNGMGGTNTTILFDLPATVYLTGANSQQYERNPRDDTLTALAWRKKDTGVQNKPTINWTSYYTSGLTDPAVGDTIYSDAACTTAVTTIGSIA